MATERFSAGETAARLSSGSANFNHRTVRHTSAGSGKREAGSGKRGRVVRLEAADRYSSVLESREVIKRIAIYRRRALTL